MNIDELKEKYIREELGISEEHGNIFAFIDFGNVNYWFEKDRQDANNKALEDDEKLAINFQSLKSFIDIFSNHARFYYGHDSTRLNNLGFIMAARDIFGKSRVFTKKIQWVRHHLSGSELAANTRNTKIDGDGIYIQIPKCNFDVEITVDAIRLSEKYDTLCLFSGDADFVSLARYLRSKGKKIIIIKGGNITHELRAMADLVINAQNIKKHIAVVKQKPGIKPGLADRTPVSTGR